MEQWRKIKNYSNYVISSLGNMSRLAEIDRLGRPLILNIIEDKVQLRKNDGSIAYESKLKLYADTWIPNPTNAKTPRFIAGNHYSLDNVEWGTLTPLTIEQKMQKLKSSKYATPIVDKEKQVKVQKVKEKVKPIKTVQTSSSNELEESLYDFMFDSITPEAKQRIAGAKLMEQYTQGKITRKEMMFQLING